MREMTHTHRQIHTPLMREMTHTHTAPLMREMTHTHTQTDTHPHTHTHNSTSAERDDTHTHTHRHTHTHIHTHTHGLFLSLSRVHSSFTITCCYLTIKYLVGCLWTPSQNSMKPLANTNSMFHLKKMNIDRNTRSNFSEVH